MFDSRFLFFLLLIVHILMLLSNVNSNLHSIPLHLYTNRHFYEFSFCESAIWNGRKSENSRTFKMKEVSLGKIIYFRIKMDKIQSTKIKKPVAFSRSPLLESPSSSMLVMQSPQAAATFSFGSARNSNNGGMFASCATPTTSVTSNNVTVKPTESNLSFYMTNPKFQGMQASPWSLQFRLDSEFLSYF